MKVLVTRPLNFAKTLCEKIRALGMEPILLPTIELKPVDDQTAFTLAIQQLASADMAIFVSRSAVEFGLPDIQRYGNTLPNLKWAGVGPGTAKALYDHGISKVIFPKTPPYGSQALLNILPIASLYQKKILIFRGNGGNRLIDSVLEQNGIIVQAVEIYQRRVPSEFRLANASSGSDSGAAMDFCGSNLSEVEVMIATSAECLNNLNQLLVSQAKWLKEIPIVVVSSSMQALAHELDFKYPILSMGADDSSIMNVLIHWNWKGKTV